MFFWWYRIITFTTPGMAAANSFDGEPASLEKAVNFQCLQSIMRAGWFVSAVFPQPRRDEKLIELYQYHKWKSENPVQHF